MANAANIEQLVVDLNNPAMRETALLELSKKREQFPGDSRRVPRSSTEDPSGPGAGVRGQAAGASFALPRPPQTWPSTCGTASGRSRRCCSRSSPCTRN